MSWSARFDARWPFDKAVTQGGGDCSGLVADAESDEYVLEVRFDGRDADGELLADLLGGEAMGGEAENVSLA
jgi:hypothetical protein